MTSAVAAASSSSRTADALARLMVLVISPLLIVMVAKFGLPVEVVVSGSTTVVVSRRNESFASFRSEW